MKIINKLDSQGRIVEEFGVGQREPPAALRPEVLSELPAFIPLADEGDEVALVKAELVLAAGEVRVEGARQLSVPRGRRRHSHGLGAAVRRMPVWKSEEAIENSVGRIRSDLP